MKKRRTLPMASDGAIRGIRLSRNMGKMAWMGAILSALVGFPLPSADGQVPQPTRREHSSRADGNRVVLRVFIPPAPEPTHQVNPVDLVEEPAPAAEEIPAPAPRTEGIPAPAPTHGVLGRTMETVTTRTRPPDGQLPEVLPAVTPGLQPTEQDPRTGCRPWRPLVYHWQAPDASHLPLYFQDVNLERYGYVPRPLRIVQPMVSGARFCATVPALPYLMAIHPPCRPVYALGDYRPGSRVPYRWQHVPLRPRPAGIEAAAITGMIFVVP